MEWRRREAKAEHEKGERWGPGSQGEDLRFDETRKEVTQKTLDGAGSGVVEQQGKRPPEAAGLTDQAPTRAEIEVVGVASVQKTHCERMNLSCHLTGLGR